MKKILLLGLLFSAFISNAQNIINEPLTGGGVPTGWSQTDVSFQTSAGGYARLDNQITSQLTTSSFDASANLTVDVTLSVAKFGSGGDGPVTVEYSLDGGNIWVTLGNSLIPSGSSYLTNTLSIPTTSSNMLVRFNRLNSASQKRLRNILIAGMGVSGANQAPIITGVIQSPANVTVTSSQDVTVSAMVTDDVMVSTVNLLYDVSPLGAGFDGTYSNSIPMTGTGNDYTAMIPMQLDDNEVYYVIEATDGNMPTAGVTTTVQYMYTVNDPVQTSFIAIQDFDQSLPEWAILSNDGSIDTSYGRTFQGVRLSNSDELELTAFTTTGFQDVELTIHNASVGGIENADALEVYVELNGAGFPTTPDITIQEEDPTDGSFNNAWTYDALNGNIAATTAGTPATFNGNMDNGYAVIKISIPANTTSVAVRIVGNTSSATEYFYIDDITLAGDPLGTDYVYDGANWSPIAPSGNATTDSNITVQAGSVTFTGDVDARTVRVEDGATLDLGAHVLNLRRNINVLGTGSIISTGATLNLAGVVQQQLNITETTLESLIVNNGGGVTINNGNLNLEGNLTLTNGTLTTNDNLTFKSTNGKTAIVAPVVSGAITGNVTVEQFYPARRAFRFVSSPVTMSGTIFSDWQQGGLNPMDMGYVAGLGTQITGGTANGFDVSATNAPSLFSYDNLNQVWMANATGTNVGLNAGDARRLLVRGDRSVSLTTVNAPATATTLTATGTLATGSQTLTMGLSTTAGGFNLVGNPYQAQVDVLQVLGSPFTQDINSDLFYVWNPNAGTRGAYVTYTRGSGTTPAMSAVNEFIQPGQAFFTVSTDSDANSVINPAIRFEEGFKNSSSQTTATFSTPANNSSVSIDILTPLDLQAGIARDGVLVQFSTTGTDAITSKDAVKIQNLDENLAIVNNSTLLSVESRAIPQDGDIIPLQLTGTQSGTYHFVINSNMQDGTLLLVDQYLNTNTTITNGTNQVNVQLDSAVAASIASDRFYLKFTTGTLGLDDEITLNTIKVYPNPNTGESINITGFRSGDKVLVNMFNLNGQKVFNLETLPNNGVIAINNLLNLHKSVYLLEVTQNNKTIVQKILIY